MVEFGPWGMSGGRVMTIFVVYVGPHFPNIGYFDVYGGILRYLIQDLKRIKSCFNPSNLTGGSFPFLSKD